MLPLLALLALPFAVAPSPYPIKGATAADLAAEMRAKGPVDSRTGKRYPAVTQWRWGFSAKDVSVAGADGRFYVQTDEVLAKALRVGAILVLPTWADQPPDSPLSKPWAEFLEKLKAHESNHARSGALLASRIFKRWRELREQGLSGGSPEELAKALEEAGKKIEAERRQWDDDYDALTKHGVLEGAVWPPAK